MQKEELSLIVKRNPRRLQSKRLWTHVAKDAALWAAIFSLAHFGGRALDLAVASVLYAVFTFRCFGLMHECVHQAAHSSRKINDAAGELYGIFCFLPFTSWREMHLEHHGWTGNVEKDPTMKILLKFERNGFKISRLVALSWLYWFPLLGFMQHLVFWAPALKKKNYLFSAGAMLYVGGSLWLLGPWALALGMVVYLYMVEIVNFPHHLGLPQYQGEQRFPTYQQNQFARSCVYPRWFAHNVLLNFNLHTEHHLLPSYPWYQLDDIHREILQEGHLLNASVGNSWILRHRRYPVETVFADTFMRDDKAA